ncbi:2-hydroxychromene-2-carboxylate isomerase [Zoogloea sp.]|uniref:2-hydroxychromene-2-carboxylate isomerase n=1 Tax=Zoogloea sp. TaxID=49181 RepID=UPI0035B4B9B4
MTNAPTAPAAALDFYFDFSSPYGYFAAEQIDALAARHGRTVNWHPFLLGATFKLTGLGPLPGIPLKGAYSMHDIARSARFFGLPYRQPSTFPIPTQHAARAFLWLHGRSPAKAKAFGLAAYRAYFVDDVNISDLGAVLDIAAGQGVDRDELSAVLAGSEIKAQLAAEVEQGIARGVFGSPFVIVDGEPFWGADRLPQLERWLQDGPF